MILRVIFTTHLEHKVHATCAMQYNTNQYHNTSLKLVSTRHMVSLRNVKIGDSWSHMLVRSVWL